MRYLMRSLALVFLTCFSLSSVDLTACGDKYLRLANRLGSGYVAEHPARVLLYRPEGSAVTAAARSLGLHDVLRRAGHNVHAVEREVDLARALTLHRYDIVIADAHAAETLADTLRGSTSRPTLLPVFDKRQSSPELAAARKRLQCLISSREVSYHALAEVDHVMELRKLATAVP